MAGVPESGGPGSPHSPYDKHASYASSAPFGGTSPSPQLYQNQAAMGQPQTGYYAPVPQHAVPGQMMGMGGGTPHTPVSNASPYPQQQPQPQYGMPVQHQYGQMQPMGNPVEMHAGQPRT